MSKMRARCTVGLLFVFSLPLAFAGCASPFGGNRDTLLDGDTASNSLLRTPDGISEQIKNSAKTLVGKGYSPEKARERYAQGEADYQRAIQAQGHERTGLLLSAAGAFENAADRWPDSALEQDALLFAGESYFFADRYPKANHAFELLLEKYPNSKYLDMVEARRFEIARYWLGLEEKDPQAFWEFNLTDKSRPVRSSFGNAVRIFDRIRIDDPTGKLADDATLAAGNAYFASAKYLDADNFYSDLRKTFPSSEHQFRAHLLGVKAKLQSYQGPDYSGDPLDEAEKLIKQIHRQFPHESAKEREYLARAYGEVRMKKAEREWYMARYRDRRGEYGAARFYYNLLATEYADTSLAGQARERIAELVDKPEVPPQRLSWIVNMFPEQDDVTPLMATAGSGATRR